MTGSTVQRAREGLPPGLALGALGVLAFSFSYPATRLAVSTWTHSSWPSGGRPWRACWPCSTCWRCGRPVRRRIQWRSLAIVAAFVVIGFPTLTGIALQAKTSAHVAVVTALMPAATAVAAVIRAGERPSRMFWLAAGAGAVAVIAFAISQGAGGLDPDDVLLLVAVVIIGIGYAEGGALSRTLGGARTICWALLLSLPLTIPVTLFVATRSDLGAVQAPAWFGFLYVSLFSMFLGFFAWYAGLARGGVARIGQVQLAQPLLTLGFAVVVLGEARDAGHDRDRGHRARVRRGDPAGTHRNGRPGDPGSGRGATRRERTAGRLNPSRLPRAVRDHLGRVHSKRSA